MIYIGCDHGGYEMKLALIAYLKDSGFEYEDMGCGGEPVDYPDIAEAVCAKVLESPDNKGVLICGTGIGISIAANKIPGIRAALAYDYYSAKYTKLHNDSNVICFGGRTMGIGSVTESLDVWLHTEFMGGRHKTRIDKISALEAKNNVQ
ncbi:MAG: ribose 5-phosphate isomerase B [Ruminiclostridium sp.]|nr:ribose 5-phosphate isomerase B [Ruminiclostridium sp.]